MKWLMMWTVIQTLSVPCKQPAEDEYGVKITMGYGVGCTERTEEKKTKLFSTREEAIAFYEAYPMQGDIIPAQHLKDFRLFHLVEEFENAEVHFATATLKWGEK